MTKDEEVRDEMIKVISESIRKELPMFTLIPDEEMNGHSRILTNLEFPQIVIPYIIHYVDTIYPNNREDLINFLQVSLDELKGSPLAKEEDKEDYKEVLKTEPKKEMYIVNNKTTKA